MAKGTACGDDQFRQAARHRRMLGKRPLDFVLLYSCHGVDDDATGGALLELANAVYGCRGKDCWLRSRKPPSPSSCQRRTVNGGGDHQGRP